MFVSKNIFHIGGKSSNPKFSSWGELSAELGAENEAGANNIGITETWAKGAKNRIELVSKAIYY